jgi:hypothetical protein
MDPDIGRCVWPDCALRRCALDSRRARASASDGWASALTATSLMIDVPMRIRSPSFNRIFFTFSPFTKVPLVEPRS